MSASHPLRTLGGPRVARGLTQAVVTRVTNAQVIGDHSRDLPARPSLITASIAALCAGQ
jgi:hypothetical protein